MSFPSIEGSEGAPLEPDWSAVYSDEFDIVSAHEEWGVVIREMSGALLLSVANGHAIRRLVEFRVQYERSSKHVAEHGPVLKGKRAKVGQWNPHWSVMNQAAEKIVALERSLGISPDGRTKAGKVSRVKKTARAADSYLKPVSK